jgi:hypothetical protein
MFYKKIIWTHYIPISGLDSLGQLSDLPMQCMRTVYKNKPISFPRQVGYQFAAGEGSFLPMLNKFDRILYIYMRKQLPTETEFNTRACSTSLTSTR